MASVVGPSGIRISAAQASLGGLEHPYAITESDIIVLRRHLIGWCDEVSCGLSSSLRMQKDNFGLLVFGYM